MDYVHYLSKQSGELVCSIGLIGERTVPRAKFLLLSVVLFPFPIPVLVVLLSLV